MTDNDKKVVEDLNTELKLVFENAQKSLYDRLNGWTVMKDPGELTVPISWDIGVFHATYDELKKAFGTAAWQWFHNARPMKGGPQNSSAQWGIMSPEGQQWSVIMEFPCAQRSQIPCKTLEGKGPVLWTLMGTEADFTSFGNWLARVTGRNVSISGADPDDKERFEVMQVFTTNCEGT